MIWQEVTRKEKLTVVQNAQSAVRRGQSILGFRGENLTAKTVGMLTDTVSFAAKTKTIAAAEPKTMEVNQYGNQNK